MNAFDDSVIMNIDPMGWGTVSDYTRDVISCNADFFRIKEFGSIIIFDSEGSLNEVYTYDVYMSKLPPICVPEDAYQGYLTMSDYWNLSTIDVKEDVSNPGSYVKKYSIQEAVLETFLKHKDLIGVDAMPFCADFRLMGQIYNDVSGQAMKTSVELYFNYIYVY